MEQLKEIWPHDLLTFNSIQDLILTENPLPEWAKDSLSKAKIVVVRRGVMNDNIPVGIRGPAKSQRFAAYLQSSSVKLQFHPDYFIEHKSWKKLPAHRQKMPAFQALVKIIPLLKKYHWGVGGSLAYEMATGLETVQNNKEHSSDIDLLIYNPPRISLTDARKILVGLNNFGVHADVQVVNRQSGFSLEEYATNRSPQILIKTLNGPVLTENPWQFLKES